MERPAFHGYRKLPNTPSPGDGTGENVNNKMVGTGGDPGADNECTVREQDRFMPIANVIRIMRKILPPHAKISDDAKETIQECVSEYISFITGEANERCQREQRKTITAEDVLWAMSKLGFDDYIEPLTIYLHRYREMEGDRASIRGDPVLPKRTPLDSFVAPPFHHHMNGYFMAGGYMRDHPLSHTNNNHNNASPAGAGSGSQGGPNAEPNGHQYK
ncbi:nuclear transcription factor Y subunit B-6 [Senna tora]|uniref:Nuclear transcription factor Y subunit B-6 n=1 Tax=Senna tora TaxID=362788 RepID=A0A834SK29_9FABA|nr:nuclear transcription factor Y subunit B-6 [Senna tora]